MFTSCVHIVAGSTDRDPLRSRVFICEDTDFDSSMCCDGWDFWSFFRIDSVCYSLYEFIVWISVPDWRLVIKLIGDGMEFALREFRKYICDFSFHRCYASWFIGTQKVRPLHFSFFETDFPEIPRRARGFLRVIFLDT